MFYFACFVFNADSFVCQCDCFMVILLLGLSLVILDLGGHCLVLVVCVLFLCAILVILDLLSFCIHLWALCILFGHLKSNSDNFYSLFAVFMVTLCPFLVILHFCCIFCMPKSWPASWPIK